MPFIIVQDGYKNLVPVIIIFKTKLSLGVQVRVFNGDIASFHKFIYTRCLL
jgi:hypothetical protein